MNNFKKDNQSGGENSGKFGERNFGDNRGPKRGFGSGRGGSRPDMHKATCSDCGKDCEVPFRPTGNKPVFCSDCFKKHGGGNSGKFRAGNNKNFSDRNSRPSFNNKPAYQNNGGGNTENYKAQFEQLHSKLDKILRALAPVISEEAKKTNALNKEVAIKTFKKVLKKSTNKKPVKNKAAAKKKSAKKKK